MMITRATQEDLAEADAAVRLIAARGFARGKDVAALLAAWIAAVRTKRKR